jgi:aspartate/methionine/tyrosine aminotransferase
MSQLILSVSWRRNLKPIEQKFARLETEHAPGQEVCAIGVVDPTVMQGKPIPGVPVDFSHGDVNETAFAPTPGSFEIFAEGVRSGGEQAYTEYRGKAAIREVVADKLAAFTGRPVDAARELIITPGTQGALFLAVASTVTSGDKVAIVRPDYFANRKLVEYMEAEIAPVDMNYLETEGKAGIDLERLEDAFRGGAKTLLFSNPNNPVGVVYSANEINRIAELAQHYGATVIVDQLYSRLIYTGNTFTHLRCTDIDPDNLVTIMGPSKTESLSGYRLGVAFGSARIIERMERLQAIVSLRAPGYCQAVLRTWFDEPPGWMTDRIQQHQLIRDELIEILQACAGTSVRATEAGSYIFPRFPALRIERQEFIDLLRLQAAVIATPGTEFSPYCADSIRFNFSQNRGAAAEAMHRVVQLANRYRA